MSDKMNLFEAAEKGHAEIAARIAAVWVYEGKFVFQGRTYDVKIRPDGQGAVVYQKSPKCLFAKDGDEWFLQAGSKTIFNAAIDHLGKTEFPRT
jgi:hypothetical protein